MGAKKRATRGKKATPVKVLTPEEQQARDQCDLLLLDFDKQFESTCCDSQREVKTCQDSISTMFKLELMKMPVDVKSMNFEEYFKQFAGPAEGIGLSNTVAEAVNDSVIEAVDAQVSNLASALKSNAKKKGRGRPSKTTLQTDSTPAASRTSSREKSANLQTPSTSRSRTQHTTPANTQATKTCSTPMITPKFDTSRSLNRTISRTAKAGEVLVSLSGSPVAPVVSGRSQAAQAIASESARIPLGGGNTLNLPMADPHGDLGMEQDLDPEQIAKLANLHKHIGNMLKAREQNVSGDDPAMED